MLLSAVVDSPYLPCLFTFVGDFYAALGQPQLPLYTWQQRRDLAESAGIRRIFTLQSSATNMAIGCEGFVDLLVVVGARLLVCGADFRFGAKALGDTDTLTRLCAQRNIVVRVLPLAMDAQGNKIGTAMLRRLLVGGNMQAVRDGLGRWYAVGGRVVGGRAVGRTLGVPTANIDWPEGVQIPRVGVYACYCSVAGRVYGGVCNVGPHPTFGDAACNVEAHLFDCDADLYGADMQVALVAFLRPIHTFDSPEQLAEMIKLDCLYAMKILEENPYD